MDGCAAAAKHNEEGLSSSKYGRMPVPASSSSLSHPPVSLEHTSSWEERFEDLDDHWKLTDDMKAALHNSLWLQRELQDQGLRHLLTQIAAAPNTIRSRHDPTTEQEDLLHRTRETNTAFASFLDKTMVIAGILERHEGGEATTAGEKKPMPLEEWLCSHPNDTPLPLTLKPLPRRTPAYVPLEAKAVSEAANMREESKNDDDEEDDDDETANEESSTSGESSSDSDDDTSSSESS